MDWLHAFGPMRKQFRASLPWREVSVVTMEPQFNIGAIFSTPLVMNKVVFFGSTDGNLYAID